MGKIRRATPLPEHLIATMLMFLPIISGVFRTFQRIFNPFVIAFDRWPVESAGNLITKDWN